MNSPSTSDTIPLLSSQVSPRTLFSILEQANKIASSTGLDDLLNQMLDLILHVSGANAGTLYLLDPDTNELIFKVVKGGKNSHNLLGRRIGAEVGVAGATIQKREPIVIDDVKKDSRWSRATGSLSTAKLGNAASIPLLLQGAPIGVIQIFNFTHLEPSIIQLLGNRMASEVEKARLLDASEKRAQRLQAIIDIIGHIGSTLDRDQILRLIVEHARLLLDAAACSLFLVDEEQKDIALYISSSPQSQTEQVRVPMGKGIIGHVIESGEIQIVNDVLADTRHYQSVDTEVGFQTRSILAVPMKARIMGLGQDTTNEVIIGGIEALNKTTGRFTEEDARLLTTLTTQATTAYRIAKAYDDVNELFFDVIQALTAAIDAKDPYTRGHSQRVSEFSLAIAEQLQLDSETLHHVRIGSILHDVGKIGVPDAILKKPGRLTKEEFDEIKKHPNIGARIMGNVRMLEKELAALAEHHERLDGSGYPNGLQGFEISLLGRIVAAADVFDALTSDRTYRDALSVDDAFQILYEGMGTHFDPLCVQALVHAHNQGKVRTQKERRQAASPI